MVEAALIETDARSGDHGSWAPEQLPFSRYSGLLFAAVQFHFGQPWPCPENPSGDGGDPNTKWIPAAKTY